jgi:hypothetical protein
MMSQNNLSNNRNEDIPETSLVEVEPTPGMVSGETTPPLVAQPPTQQTPGSIPPKPPYAGKKGIQKGQRGPDHPAYKHGKGYSRKYDYEK